MKQFETYIDIQDLLENAFLANKNTNLDKINEAFEYAKEKHGSQMRKTGHPYYVHPLAVANIVAKLNLDEASIISALLHDVIEDTDVEIEEIEEKFGKDIAEIVNGVTKLGEIKYKTDEIQQAENLRKLFLALSKDIRVLIVKLCDRLHNLMTIDGVKDRKKRRIKAIESLEIYAPLAQRIGIYQIKDLLEDLSFEIINPQAREAVLKKINEIKNATKESDLFRELEKIKEKLTNDNITAEIKFRYKSPYSIWKKMQNKNTTFGKIFDILGYRVIVNNERECYIAMQNIHSVYKFIPNSFTDYISNPKQNGYRSLHTSVITENGLVIEFQIRTLQMQNEAEFGLASHWSYKSGEKDFSSVEFKNEWISQILQILNSKSSATEILEYAKLEMAQNKVFVFTENGEIKHFPVNSTIIDFAFLIGEDFGRYFHGAEINNIFTQNAQTILENGDRIKLFKAKNQTVSEAWVAKTGLAKLGIKNALKDVQNYETSSKGLNVLRKACKARGVVFNQNVLNLMLKESGVADVCDFYVDVFNGKINPILIIDRLFDSGSEKHEKDSKVKFEKAGKLKMVCVEKLPYLRCFESKCCEGIDLLSEISIHINPNGAFVHNSSCEKLSRIIDKSSIFNIKSCVKRPDFEKINAKIETNKDFNDDEFIDVVGKFRVKIDSILKKFHNNSIVKTFQISSNNKNEIINLFESLSRDSFSLTFL